MNLQQGRTREINICRRRRTPRASRKCIPSWTNTHTHTGTHTHTYMHTYIRAYASPAHRQISTKETVAIAVRRRLWCTCVREMMRMVQSFHAERRALRSLSARRTCGRQRWQSPRPARSPTLGPAERTEESERLLMQTVGSQNSHHQNERNKDTTHQTNSPSHPPTTKFTDY